MIYPSMAAISRPKPGVRNTSQGFHLGGRVLSPWATCHRLPRGISRSWIGRRAAGTCAGTLILDISIPSSALTHCAKMPAPEMVFLYINLPSNIFHLSEMIDVYTKFCSYAVHKYFAQKLHISMVK